MNRAIIALGVAAMLTGCVPAYYGPGPVRVGVAVAPVGYDGYYDGYYGRFYDGYWGRDGFYYYSMGPRYGWRRDFDHHFRHDGWRGFHPVHGRGGPHR